MKVNSSSQITTIFGRKVTKQYKGKLQSVIEDLDLPNPVIRSPFLQFIAAKHGRTQPTLSTSAVETYTR